MAESVRPLEKNKNCALSRGKYESSRLTKPYRRFNYNKENKKVSNELEENKENEIQKEKTYKKNLEKSISINKKKHKGENKVKYNNLIKYKLAVCDSVNKRKK